MEISFVNDAFSENVDEALGFAKKNDLKYIELRKINGMDIASITTSYAFELSNKIAEAGVLVSALSSSFLDWKNDCSNFNINGQHVDSEKEYFVKLMDLADVFGAPNIVIYSYLKNESLSLEELGKKLDVYSQMALERGINLLLENKAGTNIDTIASLHKLLELYNFSNIFPLLNMGEVVASNDEFKPQELQDIINSCLYFHINDYDSDAKRYVVFGEGHIDYESILADKQNDKAVIFSLDPKTGHAEDLQMSYNMLISASEDED